MGVWRLNESIMSVRGGDFTVYFSVSSVRVVAAVAADLDLQRRQVVQPALFHFVGETLLFLFNHGAPHLLQRGIIFPLLFLFPLLSVASSPAAAAPNGGFARRPALLVTSGAAFVIGRAKSAPQAACGQDGVKKKLSNHPQRCLNNPRVTEEQKKTFVLHLYLFMIKGTLRNKNAFDCDVNFTELVFRRR